MRNFTAKDMIEFVKWYDSKKESDCHRTFEEELNEWMQLNFCTRCNNDGTDRFWKTLDMCFKEYASQFNVFTKAQLDDLQETAYQLGVKHERQQNCKHEIFNKGVCAACGYRNIINDEF